MCLEGSIMDAAEVLARAADAAMERYARGDDTAFAAVYDAVAPSILRYALRALSDPSQAEDIVQLTLLRMHRARGRFIAGAQVLPWAYTIARRLILDARRRRRRDERLRLKQLATELEREGAPAPDAELVAAETATALAAAFGRLPAAQRASFELLRRDGLSLAQAAHALGTTVTAVKLRLHRATEALRAAANGAGRKRRSW
jgi:RNA polymerase sigma-70 factor (ECF subfamily)